MEAILKFDSDEAPNCVYNEIVASNLAHVLQIPIAAGILTITGDGFSFASLALASPGIALPDIGKTQIAKVAATYRDEVAELVAFDVLIGNWDRGFNIKATLDTPHIRIFRGFDHSHAILGCKRTDGESIAALHQGDAIVSHHPFFGRVDPQLALKHAKRISELPSEYIHRCARFGKAFRSVSEDKQSELARALIKRRKILPHILEKHPQMIGRLL